MDLSMLNRLLTRAARAPEGHRAPVTRLRVEARQRWPLSDPRTPPHFPAISGGLNGR